MAIAVSVLLIAATNLANLMLARAAVRAPEFGFRLAIGGSRARLIQQVAIEGALWPPAVRRLACSSRVGRPTCCTVDWDGRESDLPRSQARLANHRHSNHRRGGQRPLLCAGAGHPRGQRAALVPLSGRGTASGSGRLGIRKTLVAVQVGLSFVLVFAAGLFARSFQILTTGESGFRPDSVLVSHVFFPESELPPSGVARSIASFWAGCAPSPARWRSLPPYSPPLSGQLWNTDVKVGGVIVGVSN